MNNFSPALRDSVLFVVGLAGIIYVTLTNGGDRPTLLVLFGAMIGLPAFLRTDEARNKPSLAQTAVREHELAMLPHSSPEIQAACRYCSTQAGPGPEAPPPLEAKPG